MIFLNLPVADLDRAREFYVALGWPVNGQTTDDKAACVRVADNICVMLLTREWYHTLIQRPLADTGATTAATYGLSMSSAAAVDALLDAAVRAGGVEQTNVAKQASEAQVGMYSRAFTDLDGHHWEPFWLDHAYARSSGGNPNSGNSRAVSRK